MAEAMVQPSGQDSTQQSKPEVVNQKRETPWKWRLLMVLCATAYLVPEAIFNAQLVNTVGLGMVGEEELHLLELFGRAISGIGVSLLVCDALGKWVVRSRRSGAATMLSVFFVCWPLTFFGQKWLVDHFIIEPSSAEERQHAFFSQVVRGALARNAIQIEGVAYDSDRKLEPSELTFMALFGGLVYSDKRLVSAIKEEGPAVVEELVRREVYSDFDSYWNRYSQLYERLSESYKAYANGSREYNSVINSISMRQSEYWLQVENEVRDGWTKYQSAIAAHDAKAEARAHKYAPRIYDYFERLNKCRSQGCADVLNARYRKEVKELGLGPIPANHWLGIKEISTTSNIFSTVLNAALTGGVSLLMQGMDYMSGGAGGFENEQVYYTDEVQHYVRKLKELEAFKQMFWDTTGYPLGIDSVATFRMHEVTSAKVRQALNRKGLGLPGNWLYSNRGAFNQAVADKVKAEAQNGWQQQLREKGYTMPPNLTWNRFQRHSEVQAQIAEQVGDYYRNPTLADWNRKVFKERLLDPAIKQRSEETYQMVTASARHFADDEQYEALGKNALRAVIVPPISMGLSLLLVILTILKLPKKYLGLRLVKGVKVSTGDKNKWAEGGSKVALSIAMIAAVLALPLFAVKTAYTEEGSTVNYFLDRVSEVSHPVTSTVLKWVLHAQPIIYPIGEGFEQALGVYASFERVIPMLEASSKNLQPTGSSRAATYTSDPATGEARAPASESYSGPVVLHVRTAPAEARVRVMNIAPLYEPGMRLPSGGYDIEVSAPGFYSQRRWVTLSGRSTSPVFNLKQR